MYGTKPILVFLACCLLTAVGFSQQKAAKDSVPTPFRKGRWLTGLSGSISTTTLGTEGQDEKLFANQYALNFSTGIFIKDSWLLGGAFTAERSDLSGDTDPNTEVIFFGPLVNYFLSKNPRGSLFLGASPGFGLYRQDAQLEVEGGVQQVVNKGNGFGLNLVLGYSYVIRDLITLNIGFNNSYYWLRVKSEGNPMQASTSERIDLSKMSFTFGFSVILDDFF